MSQKLTDDQKSHIATMFLINTETIDFLHAWAMGWYSDAELVDKLKIFLNEARAEARKERDK